jgi:hypothetical protein
MFSSVSSGKFFLRSECAGRDTRSRRQRRRLSEKVGLAARYLLLAPLWREEYGSDLTE